MGPNTAESTLPEACKTTLFRPPTVAGHGFKRRDGKAKGRMPCRTASSPLQNYKSAFFGDAKLIRPAHRRFTACIPVQDFMTHEGWAPSAVGVFLANLHAPHLARLAAPSVASVGTPPLAQSALLPSKEPGFDCFNVVIIQQVEAPVGEIFKKPPRLRLDLYGISPSPVKIPLGQIFYHEILEPLLPLTQTQRRRHDSVKELSELWQYLGLHWCDPFFGRRA